MKKFPLLFTLFALLDLQAEPYVNGLRLTPEGKIIEIVLSFNKYELILSDEGILKAIVNKITPARTSTDMQIDDAEIYQEGTYCRFDKSKKLEYIEDILVKFDLDSTRRIDEIGDRRIQYQTYYGNKAKIRRIANIDLDYDLVVERVVQIGNYKIRYDTKTNKIWRIYKIDSSSCNLDIKVINPYQGK